MTQLANISYEAYKEFKGHPKFLPYLEQMSTFKYYAMTTLEVGLPNVEKILSWYLATCAPSLL